jgi:hypothetical protein
MRRAYPFDEAFCEQLDREQAEGRSRVLGYVPPRTRPLLVVDNDRDDPCRAPWRRRW